MNDPIALNLLYVQTVAELERGWIICTKDTRLHLTKLQAKLAKKEYIKFAATLKYYGYTQFAPCFCDYPNPKTKVLIAIGDHELNMRIIDSGQLFKEGCFKVTRMRCWRITATHVSSIIIHIFHLIDSTMFVVFTENIFRQCTPYPIFCHSIKT